MSVHWIKIKWGENPDPDDEPVRYQFNTKAELDAFMHGIEETQGWFGYDIEARGVTNEQMAND